MNPLKSLLYTFLEETQLKATRVRTVPDCNQAKLLRELFSLRGSVGEEHTPCESGQNFSRVQNAYVPCDYLPNTLPYLGALRWFLECP